MPKCIHFNLTLAQRQWREIYKLLVYNVVSIGLPKKRLHIQIVQRKKKGERSQYLIQQARQKKLVRCMFKEGCMREDLNILVISFNYAQVIDQIIHPLDFNFSDTFQHIDIESIFKLNVAITKNARAIKVG